MATPHSMQLHGSISYGDGARCWENAFQAFGSAKFFWGRTQTSTWASQLRCSQGRAPHDMVCPQAKNPSYAPVELRKLTINHTILTINKIIEIVTFLRHIGMHYKVDTIASI